MTGPQGVPRNPGRENQLWLLVPHVWVIQELKNCTPCLRPAAEDNLEMA